MVFILAGSVPLVDGEAQHIFDVPSGSTVTENNALTGSSGLIKQGAGTLVLTAANQYTDKTTIYAGTLRLTGGANRLNPNSSISLPTGTLEFDNSPQSILSLGSNTNTTIDLGGSALTLTGSGTSSFLGAMSRTGNIDIMGTGSVFFNTAKPGYSGDVTIRGGGNVTIRS